MPTTKLYYNNSKLNFFEAKVLSCQAKDDKFLIELDQTAFYPEGGGQPSDTGYIDDIAISHVSDKEGILYHLADKPLEVGANIKGQINYTKRQIYTQLHSGEHIVSGLIYNLYGFNNVGFHMDESSAVIDIDGELTKYQIDNIQLLANREVFSNNKFTISYPTEEELAKIPYRSKKQLTGEIRIIYAGTADICACCGTHVTYSGEIGLIKILSAQKHRGGMRITLTAGFSALNHYELCYNSLSQISKILSSKLEETVQAVIKLQDDISEEKAISAKAKHKLIEKLVSDFEFVKEPIITLEENFDANELREYALLLANKTSSYVLALSNNIDGYKYALTSTQLDIRSINKILREQLGAKGGGKGDLCQGNIPASYENIIQAIKI